MALVHPLKLARAIRRRPLLLAALALAACARSGEVRDPSEGAAAERGTRRAIGAAPMDGSPPIGAPLSDGTRAASPSAASAMASASREACFVFAGDVALGRQLPRALERGSPWPAFGELGRWPWIANLEGTVRPAGAPCVKDPRLCLGFDAAALAHLRGAPFRALSLANNHALDHGEAGRAATIAGLRALAIEPLLEARGPTFLRVGDRELGLVALSVVGRPASEIQRALERARLQLGLARAHTALVTAFVHWGKEHDPRPDLAQLELAPILRAWGATLVVGAHAHVVQPARCEKDGATFFGLGNHLFDQRGDAQRTGALVRCCANGARFECARHLTLRSVGDPRPTLRAGAPEICDVALGPVDDGWRAHPAAARFVFVQPMASLGRGHYFALHRAHSRFDGERALRPYVFRMEGRRHRDLWSGTALARPLVAARLVAGEDEDGEATERLCAIHRGDSFLAPRPETRRRVRLVYRWTGFGFAGVDDARARAACEAL